MARLALGVLLRSAAIVALIAVYGVWLDNSESTDALSAGLLAFFLLVTFAFVWSLIDGVRHGLLVAVIVWAFTSTIAGIGIPVAIAVANDTGVTDELGDSGVFFGLLLFLPALAGVAIGGLLHRIRGNDEVPATG